MKGIVPRFGPWIAGGIGYFLGVYQLEYGWVSPASAGLAVLALLVTTMGVEKLSTATAAEGRRGLRKRRLSFMSQLIAENPFPDHVNAPSAPIHAALFMETMPTVDEIVAVTDDILLPHDRFACPVVAVPPTLLEEGFLAWGPRPGTPDWAYHVVEDRVGSEDELMAYCQPLVGEELDESRPLWQIRLVKVADSCRGLLLLRISHVVGDGVSLVHTLISLLTHGDGSAYTLPPFQRRAVAAAPSLAARAAAAVKLGFGTLRAAFKVVTLPAGPADSPNALKRSLAGWVRPQAYRLVRTRKIAVERLKKIKNALGATINDVMAAGLARAARAYLAQVGDPVVDDASPLLRVFLPYAFTQRSKVLTNKWCFLSLKLPLADMSPQAALAEVKAEIDALKSTPEAHLQFYLQQLASAVLPTAPRKQTALDTMLSHTLVFTNVPGPPTPVYCAGHKVDEVIVYIGNLISQVSALSYNGNVTVTFALDADVIEDPEKLAACFEAAIDELEAAACGDGQ
ncbi:ABC-type phosphate/phosphonate transport system [Thecamonas trahens ATCC 50062]|uniref:ABC-type phosphate/phosphonate transport system n=1 Tax=Thecamonas trahens ATCC 50062 TaxID=461836 RepID=A0A0L0DW64_THETB|nr:ABC-type phosphate/phosphonate transport system [Thecamonas trahens ATCC 50062]KNC56460.1 ABC-type phosphate/phosphonate transport system [Thecamonas trahens ATCC 50062]|eukprot:XP_013760970.1 ABC-type phosphate/phosphonate transport system [Thecamonas trahens ATCC 50062]